MNIMMTALAGMIAAAAMAGTASAENPCASINDNRPAIEQALFQQFGGSDRQIHVRSNGDFNKMHLRNLGTITLVSGCTIKYEAPAQKTFDEFTGKTIRRDGEVEWMIGFDPAKGNDLCIKSQEMKDSDWRREGQVKERLFVKRNRTQKAFSGCVGS